MDTIELTFDLLWPDGRPATETDRATADQAVHAALMAGGLPATEAGYRHEAVAHAETRGELRHALRGIPGGVPPQGLTTALGVATALWLAMTVVQIVVWIALAAGTGSLDTPWWLYSTVGGGAVVGVLWAINESHHRGVRTTVAG